MNRFEQVSSDGHQMSLAEGGSHVWKWGGPGWGGDLYSEVQCIMGNDHIAPRTECWTETTENITSPQLRWRMVIIEKKEWPLMSKFKLLDAVKITGKNFVHISSRFN